MTSDEAARALAARVRRILNDGMNGVPVKERVGLRLALEAYDLARKRKTGFQHILDDDDDDLPGAHKVANVPICRFCHQPFRPRRKNQVHCGTECRQQAYYARIQHKKLHGFYPS